MRALVFERHGGPEVLHVAEVTEPRPPARDEVLVAVAASSINGTDLGLRRGDMRIATVGRLPFVPGFDVAGEVAACGPEVTAFVPGDRVMGLLSHSGGGQAERILVRQHRLALVPESVPLAMAAALPLAGLTALQAVRGRAGLHARRPDARVLVTGASGGIGAYAVQLARLLGAHVTAISSSENVGWVRELGAHEVIDRHADGLRDLVASSDRSEVIIDAHGGAPWSDLAALLEETGIVVSTRPVSKDALLGVVARRVPGRVADLGARRRLVAVRTAPRSQDLAHLAALVERGDLRIPADQAFALDDGAAAHRHAETGARGKVVLTISGSQGIAAPRGLTA